MIFFFFNLYGWLFRWSSNGIGDGVQIKGQCRVYGRARGNMMGARSWVGRVQMEETGVGVAQNELG